jgi:hypothetical protein
VELLKKWWITFLKNPTLVTYTRASQPYIIFLTEEKIISACV